MVNEMTTSQKAAALHLYQQQMASEVSTYWQLLW